MPENSFDVAVIGGGPGGYVAAIRSAQLGMKTAIIEREALGGVCLNWGCIPTKALLRSAELYDAMNHLEPFGLTVQGASFDLPKVVAHSRRVADQMTRGLKTLMRRNGITVIAGTATLAGSGTIAVAGDGGETTTVRAAHTILATGSRPRVLPGLEPDGRLLWTAREAMVPEAMPASVLVVGSGAIGMEFASFYRSFGAEVTVVEVLPQVLPAEDEEISAFVRKQFERRGVVIHTDAKVTAVQKGEDAVTATIAGTAGTSEVTAARVILAVGVQGNVEGIGLEGTQAKVDRSFIQVDEWQRTGEPGLYAIGDVAGPPCLAHKAMHEGVICVEHIAGVETVRPLNRRAIPGCTYCTPQVASVGLTEKAAREAGYDVKVGRFPFIGNGKAVALGEREGIAKTIFDAATGELLGAHLAGAEVTELIQGFSIALTHEATEASFAETIFPHPTLSETMHESALNAFGRALHI